MGTEIRFSVSCVFLLRFQLLLGSALFLRQDRQQYFISCAKITIYIERGGGSLFAYAFTFLAALAVTFILTPAVKNFAVQIGAVDKPDARKVHHGLVPRLGGLAIYAGFMVSVILTVGFTYEMTGIMIGATCLVLWGLQMISCLFPPR